MHASPLKLELPRAKAVLSTDFAPQLAFNRLLPKGEKTGQRFLSGTMAANI